MNNVYITAEGLAINKRFFHAIDVLKRTRRIRGLQTFTRAHGLNYWNMSTARSDPEHHYIKVEWLSFLVTDYGVSAEYLLTGVGNIFKEEG